MISEVYNEDCLTGLSKIPNGSVDCVITSPPYWQLRDYGWDGQWGLEPTFQQYLEHLWQLMDEVKRVLKDGGTAWVNLGDTYNTISGNATGKNFKQEPNKAEGHALSAGSGGRNKERDINIKNKCLLLIPHRFAIGCIDRGWIVRNDIIWAKRNGMPESVTDRFSKKHEYFFFMVKNENYYFDLDGIRDKHKTMDAGHKEYVSRSNKIVASVGVSEKSNIRGGNENGKNPGSVSDFWDIPTQPSSEDHYATYNTKLIDKPIVAGCPEFVCNNCGKAREKIIKNTPMVIKRSNRRTAMGQPNGTAASGTMISPAQNEVIGLTDCGCNAGFSGGTILDPFMGTGTTGLRAMELGRNFIGIEGSKVHCDNAVKRFELFKSQTKLF